METLANCKIRTVIRIRSALGVKPYALIVRSIKFLEKAL